MNKLPVVYAKKYDVYTISSADGATMTVYDITIHNINILTKFLVSRLIIVRLLSFYCLVDKRMRKYVIALKENTCIDNNIGKLCFA